MTDYSRYPSETLYRWRDGAWLCNQTDTLQQISDELHMRGTVNDCGCPKCTADSFLDIKGE